MNNEIFAKLVKADRILLAFSGGKDSLVCLLQLMHYGFQEKLEIHHHLIDGSEDEENYFDWQITADYCRAIANHFKLPIYFSYREGGFLREMHRNQTSTAPMHFQLPDGTWGKAGGNGSKGYRMQFPMPTGNLSIRWCSAYLKIGVMAALINNQTRFERSETVVVTGERGEESPARSKYLEMEPHRTTSKKANNPKCPGKSKERTVTHVRPILDWTTKEVWDLIKLSGIVPHPCYYLKFGRASCKTCIFANNNDLRTVSEIDPQIIDRIAQQEAEFGKTIAYSQALAKKGLPQLSIRDRAKAGELHNIDPYWAKIALSKTWDSPIWLPPEEWQMPIGATEGSLASGSV